MAEVVKYFENIDPSFMWLFAIVAFILPFVKLIIAHLLNKHSVKQKNLELLLSAYNSDSMTKYEEFVVEHIISGVYNRNLSFKVISALMKSESPIESFDLYWRSRYYIKLTSNRRPFRIKKKYTRVKFFKYSLFYWVSVREFFYYLVSMSAFVLVFCMVIIFRKI